jgi:hypothetical protein
MAVIFWVVVISIVLIRFRKNKFVSMFNKALPYILGAAFWIGIFVGAAYSFHDLYKTLTHQEEGCPRGNNCGPNAPDSSDLIDLETGGSSNSDEPGYHDVQGYYRKDGRHVDSYIRSNPDGNPNNNLGGK